MRVVLFEGLHLGDFREVTSSCITGALGSGQQYLPGIRGSPFGRNAVNPKHLAQTEAPNPKPQTLAFSQT